MWNGIWNETQKFFTTIPNKEKNPYHTEVPFWPPIDFCNIERAVKGIMNE